MSTQQRGPRRDAPAAPSPSADSTGFSLVSFEHREILGAGGGLRPPSLLLAQASTHTNTHTHTRPEDVADKLNDFFFLTRAKRLSLYLSLSCGQIKQYPSLSHWSPCGHSLVCCAGEGLARFSSRRGEGGKGGWKRDVCVSSAAQLKN